MKHTITKKEQGYVCQAVNPYDPMKYVGYFPGIIDNSKWKEFNCANPPYSFIHPDPIPDNSIVDGQDLTEPFLEIFGCVQRVDEFGQHLYKTRSVISFKHPELMTCVDGVFTRKEQIKNPRFEARSKEISQEVRDWVDNYTPQPNTNFDQLYDILVDYESGEITINEAIDLINKALTLFPCKT